MSSLYAISKPVLRPAPYGAQAAHRAVSPLRFFKRGQWLQLPDVAPDRTLLNVLREDLRQTDTKEACAAGDCGACTVVVAQATPEGLAYRAVNSCIKPAHAIDGMALWTAADLALANPPNGADLHPVQQALVNAHASQCGFCTPGFVMSLFALYQRRTAKGLPVDRHCAQEALSGNLCRCTGYRPIVEAACSLQASARHAFDEAALLQALRAQSPSPQGAYARPQSLDELLQQRAQFPLAQLLAGATDAGLWLTQGLKRMPHIIDLTRVAELQRLEHYPHHVAIGAAVNLQEAFEALAAERPDIRPFAERFAGWPIRQSGTLGGNVANGSPIGDSMPLLLALDAQAVLMAWRRGRRVHRHVALSQFYTGYRKNVMQPDEVLAWVVVPRPRATEWLGAYKISKRLEDDISALCLVLRLELDAGVVRQARLGLGGVAASPMRAYQTEQSLLGQAWASEGGEQTLVRAQTVLTQEFKPISDLRASSAYRRDMLAQLLRRAWLESTAQAQYGSTHDQSSSQGANLANLPEVQGSSFIMPLRLEQVQAQMHVKAQSYVNREAA
jgi:xanthine dehydrogenase small subunit